MIRIMSMDEGWWACVLYMLLSPAAIMINKYMLSYRDPARSLLSLPLSVTWIQQLFAFGIMWSTKRIRSLMHTDCSSVDEGKEDAGSKDKQKDDIGSTEKNVAGSIVEYMKTQLLGSTLFGLQILLSNVCLKYVDVASYQIARSSSAVVGVVLHAVQSRLWPSSAMVLACILISFGFLLTAIDNWSLEISLSISSTSIVGWKQRCDETMAFMNDQICIKGLALGLGASVVGVLGMAEQKRVLDYESRRDPHHGLSNLVKHQQLYLIMFYPVVISLFTEVSTNGEGN
eukprot:GHVH01007638.1.p1 GENE.GHVH01007638.1~~GHVH01007638.1.p1  ORF type:complete len:286 (-),score=27.10 GHVH01007638.1:672-1529(-)